jgi:hypothetical protein
MENCTEDTTKKWRSSKDTQGWNTNLSIQTQQRPFQKLMSMSIIRWVLKLSPNTYFTEDLLYITSILHKKLILLILHELLMPGKCKTELQLHWNHIHFKAETVTNIQTWQVLSCSQLNMFICIYEHTTDISHTIFYGHPNKQHWSTWSISGTQLGITDVVRVCVCVWGGGGRNCSHMWSTETFRWYHCCLCCTELLHVSYTDLVIYVCSWYKSPITWHSL